MSGVQTIILLVLFVILIFLFLQPTILMLCFKRMFKPNIEFPSFPNISTTKITYKDYEGMLYKMSKDIQLKSEDFSTVPEISSSFDRGNESIVGNYNWFVRDLNHIKQLKPTVYSEDSSTIFLWIHGGGFVIESPYFTPFLLNLVKQTKMDLYSFDYPTLIERSDSFVMDYMVHVMSLFVNRNVIMIGDSAGGYYLAMLNQQNKIPFKLLGAVLFHPYLGVIKQPYQFLFDNFIAKKTPKLKMKTLQVPTFILNSSLDIFYSETKKLQLLTKPQDVYLQVDCPLCTHVFPFVYPTLDKTMEVLKSLVSFVEKNKI